MRIVLLPCLMLWGCSTAPFEVVGVADLGPLEDPEGIKSRDGGYSAGVDGRSVWVYGDSVLSLEGEDGSSWRHNTWSWTDDFDASDGMTGFEQRVDEAGAPVLLFEPTDAESGFFERHNGDACVEPCGARQVVWPGPVVADPSRGGALVFFTKIHGEPGPFNFHAVGSGVSHWPDVIAPIVRDTVRADDDHPTTLFDEDEPMFASAALVDGDQIYVYACDGAGKKCRLARVDLADVFDRQAWRFWDGEAWAAELSSAKPVFFSMDITSVHFDEGLDRYVAVWSEPLSTRVSMRVAPAPQGPWSKAVTLFEAEAAPDGTVPYSAVDHGELDADGRLAITYHRGLGDWEGELRQVLVEVAVTE